MKLEEVKKTIRDIYDFPQKGIIFRDLTTAFKDADAVGINGFYTSMIFIQIECRNTDSDKVS